MNKTVIVIFLLLTLMVIVLVFSSLSHGLTSSISPVSVSPATDEVSPGTEQRGPYNLNENKMERVSPAP